MYSFLAVCFLHVSYDLYIFLSLMNIANSRFQIRTVLLSFLNFRLVKQYTLPAPWYIQQV